MVSTQYDICLEKGILDSVEISSLLSQCYKLCYIYYTLVI